MLRVIAVTLCLSSFVFLGQAKSNTKDENNHCGGVVNVGVNNPATINYKLGEEYDNDLQCVWTLRIDDYQSNGLRFIKRESNFELRYDFIQLSAFRDSLLLPSETRTLGNVHTQEEVNITAPIIFMTFSTDDSGTGTGFSLEIEAIGNTGYSDFHMDFFSDEPTGITRLKPYFANMKTTWVITANNASTLELGIDYDTEQGADIISIFHLERNGGRILFFPIWNIVRTRQQVLHTQVLPHFCSDLPI